MIAEPVLVPEQKRDGTEINYNRCPSTTLIMKSTTSSLRPLRSLIEGTVDQCKRGNSLIYNRLQVLKNESDIFV